MFKIGDCVIWRSQAGGYWKAKMGVVVAIVKPNESPLATRYVGSEGYWLKDPGLPRSHESYLVRVGKSKRLYWPRVSNLKGA